MEFVQVINAINEAIVDHYLSSTTIMLAIGIDLSGSVSGSSVNNHYQISLPKAVIVNDSCAVGSKSIWIMCHPGLYVGMPVCIFS